MMKVSFSIKLLPLAGAFLFLSCQHKADQVQLPEIPAVQIDSTQRKDTLFASCIKVRPMESIRRIDAFAYSLGETGELICHSQSDCDSIQIELKAKASIYLIINANGTFNEAALQHYDSLLKLTYSFDNEDPRYPLMSAQCELLPGDEIEVEGKGLLCTIQLSGVSSILEEGILAMNPRVHLENISGEAEVFREAGFPNTCPLHGETVWLPCDIGLLTQYPGTKLYCYPNDLPESSASNPQTILVFECEVNGETMQQTIPLHPLERGCVKLVEVTIH